MGLAASCAPEIRRNTKHPDSSKLDPGFCLCGYDAVRPALLPSGSAGCGRQSTDCSPLVSLRSTLFASLAAKAAISGAGSPLLFRSWQPSGSPSLLLGCVRRWHTRTAPECSDETKMQRRERPGSSCAAGRGLRLRRPGHGKRRRTVLARVRWRLTWPSAPVAAHHAHLTSGINKLR